MKLSLLMFMTLGLWAADAPKPAERKFVPPQTASEFYEANATAWSIQAQILALQNQLTAAQKVAEEKTAAVKAFCGGEFEKVDAKLACKEAPKLDDKK